MLRMDDYNASAKAYWWITAILGSTALALALRSVAALPYVSIAQIVLIVAAAGVTGAFPHAVPGTKTSITGAEVFIFLVLLMNGPAAAALAAAAEAAVGSYRTSTRWTSRIGSPAQAGLAMYACGTLFAMGEEYVRQRFGQPTLFSQLLLLLPLAMGYFATGTLLTASLFTLKQRQAPASLEDPQASTRGSRSSTSRARLSRRCCTSVTTASGWASSSPRCR